MAASPEPVLASYCPICEEEVAFLTFNKRPDAQCPGCGSLERHRLDWIFLRKRTNLFDGPRKKMLHVAPEVFLAERLDKLPSIDYLSADLKSSRAMVKMDLTDIHYPDGHFDVIYCSHVLEHIPDDVRAIGEMHRVLRKGGWAVLQVPITTDHTYENPSIVAPEDRARHFGQSDHVRLCGPDYADRIRGSGFDVQVLRAAEVAGTAGCARMGFLPDKVIFYCTKH